MNTPEWVIEMMLRIDDVYKAPRPAPPADFTPTIS